jgi:hypothetical protein
MADVPAGADVVGSPVQPVREYFRQVAALKRLAGRRPGPVGGAVPDRGEGAGPAPAANRASD